MLSMKGVSRIVAGMSIYTDPIDDTPLDERILVCLRDGNVKTFSQLEVLCGITDPAWATKPEEFSNMLDTTLQALIKVGKVLLVAKRPELCFKLGTVLDRILGELDAGDKGRAQQGA